MVWYKEFFKFLMGVAAWDGIVAVWCLLSGLYPIRFFWISFNQVWLGITFFIDAILTLVLYYFAWGIDRRVVVPVKIPVKKK